MYQPTFEHFYLSLPVAVFERIVKQIFFQLYFLKNIDEFFLHAKVSEQKDDAFVKFFIFHI